MPAYLITIGVKANRYRHVARVVEYPDLDAAKQAAQSILERARQVGRLEPLFDSWVISEPMPNRTAKILATGPQDGQ